MDDGWSNDAARPAGSGSIRPVGARFHAQPTGADVPAGERRSGGRYPVVMRGYERRRVDLHVAELTTEIKRLRAEIAGWQDRWRDAQDHVGALETELRSREEGPPPVEFGAAPIADRVLKHARLEAAKIRAKAMREADLLLARARTQAGPATGAVEVVPDRPSPMVRAQAS